MCNTMAATVFPSLNMGLSPKALSLLPTAQPCIRK
jgi:hypothetical protein